MPQNSFCNLMRVFKLLHGKKHFEHPTPCIYYILLVSKTAKKMASVTTIDHRAAVAAVSPDVEVLFRTAFISG